MRASREKKQIDSTLKPEELERQAYAKSIKLLGNREHSTTELRKKLGDSGFSSDTIETTLDKLIASGYQSDERFANLYAESLLRKNYGPMMISAKLSARGIESSQAREAIQAAISDRGVDWSIVASDALLSKFSAAQFSAQLSPQLSSQLSSQSSPESSEIDQVFMGKCARFLNRRGFSSTDSITAIRLAAETVSD